MKLNNKNGFILIVASLAVVVVLGLSAAFFLRSVGEKRIVDVEKFSMQADFLAEAGANHGLSELRQRVGADLSASVNAINDAATINAYYTSGNSLGFLRDYAYAAGDSQFSVSGSEATLDLTALNVVTNIQGVYSSQIVVTEASAPENPQQDEYVFYYNYIIKGTGESTAISINIVKRVNLSGSFSVRVNRDNLARYSVFTNHHTASNGSPVWFNENTNFYGPVRTNDRFRFAHNPGPYFSGEVSQHEQEASFYNNGDNGNEGLLLDDDHNEEIDVPTFDDGFERGVGTIDLQSAVDADRAKNQALGGTSEPPSNGVYLPSSGGALIGGIYIKGDVSDFELTMDSSNNPRYIIRQGFFTTTRVTVNYTSNTTSIRVNSGPTTTYNGIPDGIGNEGTIIYTQGQIQQLHGTVQRNSVVTLSSEEDMVISGNVRYQDYNAGPPINATGYTNMLGLISFDGNVRIGLTAPDNVNVHAIVMAPNGQFQVDNYWWGDRGTATLLGGAISDYYGAFGTFGGNGYRRNFVHDARVLSGSTPPYFLFMTNFVADDSGLDPEDRPLWRKVEDELASAKSASESESEVASKESVTSLSVAALESKGKKK